MLGVKGAGQNALNQGLGCHGLEVREFYVR